MVTWLKSFKIHDYSSLTIRCRILISNEIILRVIVKTVLEEELLAVILLNFLNNNSFLRVNAFNGHYCQIVFSLVCVT